MPVVIQLIGSAALAATIEDVRRSLEPFVQVVEAINRQASQIEWLRDPEDD